MLGVCTLALLIAVAAPLSPAAEQEAGKKAEAQALLRQGSALFQKGDKAGALDKFNAAYSLFPSPKLLFNIGQALRDLGRTVEAMEALERFLAEAEGAPQHALDQAKKAVAALEKELGRVEVTSAVAGAQVLLDDRPLGETPLPGPVWVMPGRHRVVVEAKGHQPGSSETEVAAGGIQKVVVEPRPEPLPPPVPAVVTVAAPAAATSGATPGRIRNLTWTWVAAGTTVAVGAGAAIAGASMRSRFDELRSTCGSRSPLYPGCTDDQIDGVRLRRNLANGLWIATGLAAAATGTLFFLERRPARVGVSADHAGRGIGLVAWSGF